MVALLPKYLKNKDLLVFLIVKYELHLHLLSILYG